MLMTVESKELQTLLAVLYALHDYDQHPTNENGQKIMKAYTSALKYQEGRDQVSRGAACDRRTA